MNLADFSIPYEQKKRSAAMSRDATLSQNAYSRFLSQSRGTRDLADLERNRTSGLEQLGTSLGRRGLGSSGIRQQTTNDYGSAWLQDRQNINDTLMQALRQLDFADKNAYSSYDMTAADLEQQKQADILATAAQLQNFRPFLGS
jgi:hypothetical protein